MTIRSFRTLVAALVVCAIGLASAHGQDQRRLRFLDIRALGMGGPGITTFSDISALAYNPAMLSRATTHIEILNIHVNASREARDLYDYIDRNEDALDNFTDTTLEVQNKILDEMAEFDNNWMGVGVFPGLGATIRNFSVGTYGASDLGTRIDKGIFEPRIYVDGEAEWLITGGAATAVPESIYKSFLPGNLYAGAAIRIVQRWAAQLDYSASDFDVEDAYDSLVSEENKGTGWGFDLGLLYEAIPGRLDLGVQAVDVIGEVDGESRGVMINIGGSFQITEKLFAAADFNDFFFRDGGNAFTHLYFGGEYRPAGILAVRGGFGQGYPSAGVGLDFKYLTIDAAYFGIEQTGTPGGDGDYSYALRLGFSI